MSTIQEVFTDFLIANFALYAKGTIYFFRLKFNQFLAHDSVNVLSNDDLQKLTIDFIRPHECARFVFRFNLACYSIFRRLDLLLRLKEEVIDKEPTNEPANVFLFLKVARVFNMVMQTSCPALESLIAKYVSCKS